MAKISIYNLDNNVTALDKVIGADFTGSVIKNFTQEYNLNRSNSTQVESSNNYSTKT